MITYENTKTVYDLVENAGIWSIASVHMPAHVRPYVRLRPAIWRLDEGHAGG